MGVGSRMRSALRNLLKRRVVENRLDDEIRAYVELLTDEKIASGVSPAKAHRAALIEAGGMEQLKQSVRDQRAGTGIELLWQDARYGLRQLRRNPAFTWTAVITLGLGIGATTAIFSAVYSLLLQPLPYRDAGRLVSIFNTGSQGRMEVLISPDFVAAQNALKSFDQVGGYMWLNSIMSGAGDPVRVNLYRVTANFFPMLGVTAKMGRTFASSEDRPDGPAVILISHRLWRSQFHGDMAVIGKSVDVNGKNQTIIGVLPPDFNFPNLSVEPDVYSPIDLERDTSVRVDRGVFGVWTIAHLRPGVSRRQAQAEVQTFFDVRMKSYPAPIAKFIGARQMIVESLQQHIAGDNRKPLYILLACVAAVLLIACANVANLQLARAVTRQHETALSGALGASRFRLIRQFLVESLVLSALSAALGLAIALVITTLVRNAGVPGDASSSHLEQVLRLPFGKLSAAIHVDGWVLTFTAGLALLTTILFGLAPAISGTRWHLRNALQGAGLRITENREQNWLRHGLLVFEVGLAVVLLASAGLLVRSFMNVMRYDAGFDSTNVLTGETMLLSQHFRTDDAIRSFTGQLLSQLQAIPGVEFAALTSTLPLGPTNADAFSFEDNVNPSPAARVDVLSVQVTPDYFHAMGTPILRGRVFNEHDTADSASVIIVNRAFQKRFLAGDAIDKRFRIGQWVKDKYEFLPSTVVGVVADVRHNAIEQEVQPEIYEPMAQIPASDIQIVLHSGIDTGSLANSMRKAVLAVNREQPLFKVETMDQRVSDLIAQRQFMMLLIATFAVLAVLLSAVGIYGVFLYSVNQRKQEMGIRLALGSSRNGLVRMIVMQAVKLIAIGGAIGVGAALLSGSLLASMLVGVTAHDGASFAFAWIAMTLIAMLSSALPAIEAARTDLVQVLRAE